MSTPLNLSEMRALLFDVDKTLTNSSREVSDRTRAAVAALSKRGYLLGVCTGRHPLTITSVLEMFPTESIHITCGGGQLIHQDGSIVHLHPVPADIASALINLADTHHARILFQGADGMYGNAQAIEHAQSYFLAHDAYRVPKPLDSLVALDHHALITLGDAEDSLIAEVSKLPVTAKVMTGYSGRRYIDVTAQGVTKATGVIEWSKYHGIRPTDIIGFGDSANDLEFLQIVGYAVAMGNATTDLKELADAVTDDHDHDGVAVWIEQNMR